MCQQFSLLCAGRSISCSVLALLGEISSLRGFLVGLPKDFVGSISKKN